jgi:hypothetical protein
MSISKGFGPKIEKSNENAQQIIVGCNAKIFIDFPSFRFIFWQIEKLNKILMMKQPIYRGSIGARLLSL